MKCMLLNKLVDKLNNAWQHVKENPSVVFIFFICTVQLINYLN